MMAGAIGWSRNETLDATLRELVLCYQSKLLHEWDHTATLHAAVHNFTALFERANLPKDAKPAMKPRTVLECHPFRESKTEDKPGGITPKNFGVMKDILKAMLKRKHG